MTKEQTAIAANLDTIGQNHKLRIYSLRDVEAICTCGKWSIAFTGQGTRKFVQTEFNKHLAFRRQHGS